MSNSSQLIEDLIGCLSNNAIAISVTSWLFEQYNCEDISTCDLAKIMEGALGWMIL